MDALEKPDQVIGRYELRALLGRGGFGTVYRAYDTRLEVERAVKILHPILNSSPEYIARFAREARLVARMDHPNIVPVYDFDQDSARYYLVMMYMGGGSLAALLKDGRPVEYARMLDILRQSAAALDYAHSRDLVHRDVKPANVLFEAGGAARLGDFGFARALTGGEISSLSLSGGLLGTPAYMAPELWRNNPASPASDVYSLGCLVTEMLTGQVLFPGDSPAEIMTSHVLDGPQFPERWPAATPAGLEDVLRRSLARKPEDRFQTAGEFYRAAAGLKAASPTQAAARQAARPQPIHEQPAAPVKEPPAGAAASPAGDIARARAEALAAARGSDWAKTEAAIAGWLKLAPSDPEALALRVDTARRRVERDEANRYRRAREDARQSAERAGTVAPTPVEENARAAPERQAAPPASARPARAAWFSKKTLLGGAALSALAFLAVCVVGSLWLANLNPQVPGGIATQAGAVVPVDPLPPTRTAAPILAPTSPSQATPAPFSGVPDLSFIRSNWPWTALDDFETNNNGWTNTTFKDQWGTRSSYFNGGLYYMDGQILQPFTFWSISSIAPAQDFYVSTDMHIVNAVTTSAPASAGLLLRNDASGYYQFLVSQNGYFSAGYMDTVNATWNEIYGWQAVNILNPDGPNQIAAVAQGDQIWLFINETFVGGITGAIVKSGTIDPVVSLFTAGDYASVAFDNFEMRAPP